jgi:predicted amidophosphoribosyltransferase
LEYLKKNISLHGLPLVSLSKYTPHGFAVAQKSLKTRKQRIQNARETIVLEENDLSHYTTVLLIDDFVGSGATLNETAKKLKNA